MAKKRTIIPTKQFKNTLRILETVSTLVDLNGYERERFRMAEKQFAAARRRYRKYIVKKRRDLEIASRVGTPLKKFFTIDDDVNNVSN